MTTKLIRLVLLLFLFSINIVSQNVAYASSNENIANPERGLQKYSKNINSAGNYNFVNQTTLTNWRTTDKITVIYRYVMLSEFINNNSTINNTYLTNLQTDFNRIRNAGLKVIIRPAYTTNYDVVVQPNKQTILNHISQLSSIINANKDIIVSVQCGFIGVYGEWYYTGGSSSSDTDGSPEFGDEGNISNAQWLNRKDVVDAMLANFDNLPIQVRYATAKREMYGSTFLTDVTAYQNTPLARVGFYNDAFLNSYGDMGTYNISNCTTPVGTTDYNFIANAAQYLPMNGESNGYNPCNGGFRTTGENAVVELNQLNFSTLNRDYHPDVWGGWIATGHYDEIVRNLGYRLQLNSTTLTVGSTIDFIMNISNVGYANVVSPKNAYLVFVSTDGTEYKKLLSLDVRLLKATHTISESLVNDLPDGQYTAHLHLADQNLESRPEYSIRLANSDVAFNATTGYNNLNQVFNVLNSTCAITTVWNGSMWSSGSPNLTVIAQIDGPYTATAASSFSTCNLIVNSTLTINNNAYVEVLNDIIVNPTGTLLVRSGGKLIPVSDTSTSTGNVTVQRTTPSLKLYDYTYWSSPTNAVINSALLPTNWWYYRTFTFETQNFYDIQTQLGTTITPGPDGQDDDGDAWVLVNSTSNFVPGKGYASMVQPNGIFPRTETVSFTGGLNAGIISYPMVLSANATSNIDDFNLVGNPYSASIFADDFINANIDNILGTLSFWSHAGSLSSAYPGLALLNFSTNDYAHYNLSGGINASFGGKTPSGYIASCQGFMIQAKNASNLVFRPSFMAPGYLNDTPVNFFRLQNNNQTKYRISMSTALGLYSQQLINYNDATTLDFEDGWDLKQPEGRSALKFYTIENDIKYKIQARGSFDISDVVKVGYFSAIPETYTITLDSIDGIDNVYVKDYGVSHTLPYTFTTEEGEFNNRFELVYANLLGVGEYEYGMVVINPRPSIFEIINLEDGQVKVYDMAGKQIDVKLVGNLLDMSNISKGIYLLRVEKGEAMSTFKISN
jgi:hypothetical protein